MNQIDEILFKDRLEWRNWLELNHDKSDGIWLIYFKKHTKKPSVSYNEAVEEALCFGWIDSVIKSIDIEIYKQKFTPRRKNSVWSKVNRERVAKMIDEDKMTVFGMVKVEEAKNNGQWEQAYGMRVKPILPVDLEAELQKNEIAYHNFINFAYTYQSLYIYWLNRAKRQDTRMKRIHQICNFALENRKSRIL